MGWEKSLFLGTSGLVLPYKNQLHYPPQFEGHSRLQVYSALTNSIEVNSIFYKLPRPATVKQWTDLVGDSFRFTFKLSKRVTHIPSLNFSNEDLQAFTETISAADEKGGCILVQFPASVTSVFSTKLDSLLSSVANEVQSNWCVAVEFRHRSWYTGYTYELLDKYGATLVYHDKHGSQSPQPELAASHIYLRFHGPGGNYKGSYEDDFLHEFATYICGWLKAGKVVYAYFNNTMGAAFDNMRTLRAYVEQTFSNPDYGRKEVDMSSPG